MAAPQQRTGEMSFIEEKSNDSSVLVEVPPVAERVKDENEMQISNNPLIPEILCQVLTYLPQAELVRNRSVCRYWRDTIDQHCPLKVTFEKDDAFLERKFQLRISECNIAGIPEDSTMDFASPQSIKSIKFHRFSSSVVKSARRLLNQVKPYLNKLEIEVNNENVFTPPYIFPMIRELRIKENYEFYSLLRFLRVPVTDSCNILFCHRMSLLQTLYLHFPQSELQLLDETYLGFFTFLAAHQQNMKCLDVNIQLLSELRETVEIFKLSSQVKSLLTNGTLQLEKFELTLPSRYISAWSLVIQKQKTLVELTVKAQDEYFRDVGPRGVAFHVIRPGIESSCATLRTVCLNHIISVGPDGLTWIPLDCIALRAAVNLTKLKLYRNTANDGTRRPNEIEGAPIINLGEIPLTNLKVLSIYDFVCDSGELQFLVDNAPLLEKLSLDNTQAPFNNPRFASTGVHGGIIHSFVQKPNKKGIKVQYVNDSNQEENDKLNSVRHLYPKPDEEAEVFFRRF